MIDYTLTHLDGVLTAITMILIGGWLFEARDGFFHSGSRFRGKFEALLLLLVGVTAASLASPAIEDTWQSLIAQYGAARIVGAGLILAMLAVNHAAEWRFDDWKSIVVYGMGGLIVWRPDLLYLMA